MHAQHIRRSACDVVAQLLERRTQDPMDSMTRVRAPSGAQVKLVSFLRVENVVLTLAVGVPNQPLCVYACIRMITHARTLKSMSELGGLRKHTKTQHALVGLGSAALAAAVVLPR